MAAMPSRARVADGLHVGSDVHGFSVLRLGNPLLNTL